MMDINFLENEGGYSPAEVIKELSEKLVGIDKLLSSMKDTEYTLSLTHGDSKIQFEEAEEIYDKIIKCLKKEKVLTLTLLKNRVNKYGK